MGLGVGVGDVDVEFRAKIIACISAALRIDSRPMPPKLLLMAFCSLTIVAPSLVDVAIGPWQLEQFAVYKASPPTGGEDAEVGIASFIARISSVVNPDSLLMPPTSVAMAVNIRSTELLPLMDEFEISPWQLAQFAAYRLAPSVDTGTVGILVVITVVGLTVPAQIADAEADRIVPGETFLLVMLMVAPGPALTVTFIPSSNASSPA